MGGGVKLTAFSILLIACKKQPGTSVSNNETPSTSTVSLKAPSVENGILKFDDFKSFRYYKPSSSVTQSGSVKAKNSSSFISMQDAFDSITKADALLAQELEKKYPNGPASVFNNTHTPIAGVFPNSVYVEGNSTDGYWYESNSFDKGVINKINKDGFVQIANLLFKYSKDSLSVWNVGNTGLQGRLIAGTSTFSSKANDKIGMGELYKFVEKAVSNNKIASRTLIGWIEVTSATKSADCRNTVRVDGKNRRVIGRLAYHLYALPGPLTSTLNEISFEMQSRSLTGRLFGSWYDNWNTANEIQYRSVGSSESVYDIYLLASNDYVHSTTPFTTNWNYGSSQYRNGVNDFYVYPDFYGMPIGQYVALGNLVIDGTQPQLTSYRSTHIAYTGFSSMPTCGCEINW